MILTSAATLERVRSIGFAVLTLSTVVALLGNAIINPTGSNLSCSPTNSSLDAVLTIGLWVLAIAASLGALSATYHQLQPKESYKRVMIWAIYLGSIPALLVLPSSTSLSQAAGACSTGNFFTYLSWYMMVLVSLAALFCIHLLVHGVRHHQNRAEQNLKTSANAAIELSKNTEASQVQLASAIKQLRTPLTGLRGQIETLLQSDTSKSTTEAKVALEKINASAKQMALTIETHLDLTKVESGKLEVNLVDMNLRDTVEQICDEMRPTILKKSLILLMRTKLQSQSIIHADRSKVTQIVTTLISHAHENTNRGTITAFVRDDVKAGMVHVDIIDTGVGMSAYDTKTVFKKYADSDTTNNTCSVNLKLCLAQKLAETMGGSVSAASEGKGKGSRFTLSIPLAM